MGQRGFPLLAHVVFIEVYQLPLDRKYFAYRMPSSPKVTLLIESVSAPKAPFAQGRLTLKDASDPKMSFA